MRNRLLSRNSLVEEAVLGLLILLDTIWLLAHMPLPLPVTSSISSWEYIQIAASTAPDTQTVDREVSQEPEARLDLMSLQDHHDDVAGEAAGDQETQAGGVDGRVVLQRGVVVQTVVRLAEGDAGAAAGDGAWCRSMSAMGRRGRGERGEGRGHTGINRVEEGEEAVVPWLRGRWHLGRDGLGMVQEIPRTVDPVRDVVLLRLGLHRRGWWGSSGHSVLLLGHSVLLLGHIVLLLGGHFEGGQEQRRSKRVERKV